MTWCGCKPGCLCTSCPWCAIKRGKRVAREPDEEHYVRFEYTPGVGVKRVGL